MRSCLAGSRQTGTFLVFLVFTSDSTTKSQGLIRVVDALVVFVVVVVVVVVVAVVTFF